MNTKFTLLLATAGSVLFSGCFDGDSSKDASVRIVHASSDAPAVNVRVNNTTVLSGADYKQAAELTPRAGSSTIAIDFTTTVIETDASLRFDTHYDVIAVGKVGDSSISPLVLAGMAVGVLRRPSGSVLPICRLMPRLEESMASVATVTLLDDFVTPWC
ncbi:DUF4397 domain-containing protein [Marinobacter sediminum]|uniref:DUF4397 domain-containing protein n=1 Tax=Marinobacter sediminum TaxID=256323 RepID=UPI00193A0DF3|nr:DUF4397 domain-containing protein [Marinobacter sediminum]